VKLSGKHDTYIVIGIVRVPVVHVHALSISVTNVDKVAIRRLLSLPFSLFSPRRYKKYLLCILFGSKTTPEKSK
jgi:hypothetical protein